MTDKISYKGVWWLPNNPERQVHGELNLEPSEGANIELDDALRDEPYPGLNFSPVLLLGKTYRDEDITLYRLIPRHVSAGSYRFYAHAVFIGAHFLAEEHIHFKSLTFTYAHLNEWVDRRDINLEPNSGAHGLSLTYRQSARAEAKIDGFTIAIRPYLNSQLTRIRVVLEQGAAIDVESDEEQPLTKYMEVSRRIQDFLSLGMGTPTFPTEVTGKTELAKRVGRDGKDFLMPIDIHYQPIGMTDDVRDVHSFEMPFTLSKIEGQLEAYLKSWMSKSDLLGPVYDLYLAPLYRPNQYLQSTFLLLIQALETYHRRRFGGRYQTDEDYKGGVYRILVDAIPKDLPADFRRALIESTLSHANEFSLSKRLKDLTKRLSQYVASGFLCSRRGRVGFIRKVSATRNYLTHYNPSLREQSANGDDLYLITERLRAMLELCLFEEIGFDAERIKQIVSQNRRYTYLLRP